MRLIVGPAGSGKTSLVLEQLRAAVRAGRQNVRLLVPTATLAQHLQNQVARDGVVLRPKLIQTLSGFVREWCGEAELAPQPVVYLLVEEAVRRINRAEFAQVGETPGFCASLARTIEEFASAGCRAARLQEAVRAWPPGGLAPLGPAFLAIYEEVEQQLQRRKLALRAWRLEYAAEQIAAHGTGGIGEIWLDGFHALPDPELGVIAALARHAEVTLTAGEDDLSQATFARLRGMGFAEERVKRARPAPAIAVVKAANIEREAEDIARRILDQVSAGRPFREMGVVVRPVDAYARILRTTLERFGIPARFYFDEPLEEHPVARFLTGAVDAMLGGWDHAATMSVLRLAPRFSNSGALDQLDFAVREQMPLSGLGALKELADECHAARLHPLLDHLRDLEEWRSLTLAPRDWTANIAGLRTIFRPEIAGRATHERALEWRGQAEALDLFDDALAEAAQALEPHPMPLEPFWRTVKSVLRLKVVRLADGRRNVVHVLSAPEARQWVLPVMFVCGLVEKQFPKFQNQEPFFPDAARCRLNEAGIRVRTVEEFEREERALFDSAVTRATLLTTITYPEFDGRGERNLRSLYLEDFPIGEEPARTVRPKARRSLPFTAPAAAIRSDELFAALTEKTATVAPTALEGYLQCAFQYFGRYTLRLRTAPPRPEDRLDFLTQGNIIHKVLKVWYEQPQDISALFARIFAETLEENRIQNGYHTERLRNSMLDDLKGFAADDNWPRQGWRSMLEAEFQLPLEDGFQIRGKLDRLDVAEDGRSYVFDYKYSNGQNTKSRRQSELLLQPQLYFLAAGRFFRTNPQGMFYIGLKAGVAYQGWSAEALLDAAPLPENWAGEAAEKAIRIVREIRQGRIEVAPADTSKCRFCDCRDVCRVTTRQDQAMAEGA